MAFYFLPVFPKLVKIIKAEAVLYVVCVLLIEITINLARNAANLAGF